MVLDKNIKVITVSMIMLMAISGKVAAQSVLGSLFSQQQTQLKYYLQQIAALQLFTSYLQKGYSTIKDGTGTISNIKSNDLTQHTNHFDSLKTVRPAIRNSARVKAIIAMQADMVSSHDKVYPQLQNSGQFSATELQSIQQAYSDLLQRSTLDLDELQLVITDGQVQMTDDARQTTIDRIYADMKQRYGQINRLNNESLAVMTQRTSNGKDGNGMKTLYGMQ